MSAMAPRCVLCCANHWGGRRLRCGCRLVTERGSAQTTRQRWLRWCSSSALTPGCGHSGRKRRHPDDVRCDLRATFQGQETACNTCCMHETELTHNFGCRLSATCVAISRYLGRVHHYEADLHRPDGMDQALLLVRNFVPCTMVGCCC